MWRLGILPHILCAFRPGGLPGSFFDAAGVAELVDAPDSKSGFFTEVGVRFPPSAPLIMRVSAIFWHSPARLLFEFGTHSAHTARKVTQQRCRYVDGDNSETIGKARGTLASHHSHRRPSCTARNLSDKGGCKKLGEKNRRCNCRWQAYPEPRSKTSNGARFASAV